MSSNTPSHTQLLKEIAELRARLGEAEPTLSAIRAGEVDALVIYGSQQEQVVLLEGADSPYRLLMQAMEQGAFMMTSVGQVLYCNQRLADLLRTSADHVTGTSFRSFLGSADQLRLDDLLSQAQQGSAKDEIILRAVDGTQVPARLVCNLLTGEEIPIVAALVTDLTERKHVEAQLQYSTEELSKLAARLQVAQEEERTRIAREIHDVLGGALTALKLDLAKLRKLAPPADQELQAKLEACFASINSMMQAVRRIATDLRPALLDEFGLLAAIEWQLQDFQTHSGVQSELISNVNEITLDPESSTAVFRIFQEALTNVARHAQANRVEVRIEKQADDLLLQIQDNGRGFDKRDLIGTKSLGVLGMRERFRLLSGQFDIQSAPGEGTTVQIRIPGNNI